MNPVPDSALAADERARLLIDAQLEAEVVTADAKEARKQLYQKLGRCMIRLQQIELGMKWLASHTEFQSPVGELTERFERREARISKQTLGTVTEAVSMELLKPLDWESLGDDTDEPARATLRLGMTTGLEGDHLESVQSRAKDLVARRNVLVHGLIASHDIWSSEGVPPPRTTWTRPSPSPTLFTKTSATGRRASKSSPRHSLVPRFETFFVASTEAQGRQRAGSPEEWIVVIGRHQDRFLKPSRHSARRKAPRRPPPERPRSNH